jgi:hypothetical protein
MGKSLFDIVKGHATDARYWAEGRAGTSNMSGWCAIASAYLFRLLKQDGIDAEIRVRSTDGPEAHVFLCVDDYVVDVTADQFRELRNQPIVVIPERLAEAYYFYQSNFVFNSVEDLIRHQKKTRWVSSQVAYSM